jgi:hypothetical protein
MVSVAKPSHMDISEAQFGPSWMNMVGASSNLDSVKKCTPGAVVARRPSS